MISGKLDKVPCGTPNKSGLLGDIDFSYMFGW